MSTSAIKEGFICADCHAQFTNPNALLSHYQSQHSEDERSTIKGLIDKAKNKLTISNALQGSSTNGSGGGQGPDESSVLLRGPPRYFDTYTDNIPDGRVYSHYETFKKIRTIQVEKYSSDANKVLIRLQKLLTLYCEDSGKRKAQEQEIVSWIDEKIVHRCPDCTEPFGILLRKHHCRLCGSILCEHCSVFISREFGESIIKCQMGVSIVRDVPPPRNETVADRLAQQGLSVFNSSARNQSFSLDPVVRDQNYNLRCCSFCYNLVAKKQFLASQSKAIITQFYDKLITLQRECEVKNVEYARMIASLMAGESLYSVELATSFRNDIIKNTEKIDILSKKILVLGYDSGEVDGISETEKRLRSRIRNSTVNWIRDFLSGLRIVPEKAAASADGKPAAPVVKFVDGWTASQPDTTGIDESMDVMEIQIRNMKKWIDEARMAKKLDEVEMLEANLSELLQMHYQQSL